MARARLGLYILLEQLRKEPITPDTIREYFNLYRVELRPDDPALDILTAYVSLVRLNVFASDLPMYVRPQRGAEQPWDYEDRWAIHWVHTLAVTYHWSRDEILDLRVDEAAAYLQEIAIEKQLDVEWEHSLSPNAYRYDAASKTNKFEPLTRPRWMQKPQPAQAQQTPVPQEFLPVGPTINARSLRLP